MAPAPSPKGSPASTRPARRLWRTSVPDARSGVAPLRPRKREVPPGRRCVVAVVAVAALVAGIIVPGTAAADPDPSGTPITPAQYSILGFDSQSPPYPAPPALDGTAAGAFDNDFGSQWTSAFTGDGVGDPLPHWLAFDVGCSCRLTGLDYSVKNQGNGPAKDVAVYATDDPVLAANPGGSWGTPVATATLHQPTGNTEVQTVLFDNPVTARYVKFQANSAQNGKVIIAASELRVRAIGDTSPTAPPDQDAATPVLLSNGNLAVHVAKEFPTIIDYQLDGKTLAGQRSVLSDFQINGTAHTATTTMTSDASSATYVSTFADLPDLTITSKISVTDKGTVQFAITSISGAAADTVDQLSIPGQSLLSVSSTETGATLARTKISTDSTTTADAILPITGSTVADSAAVGSPYAFVSNADLAAGVITNATDDSKQDNNDNWNTRLQTRITASGSTRTAAISVGNWTYAPAGATDPRVKHYQLPAATVVLSADANGDGTVDWQDGAIAFRNAMTVPLGADRVPERVVQHIPFNFASQATNPFDKTLDNVRRISASTDDLGQWVLEKGYASEGHDSGHPDYGGDINTRAGGLADFNKLIDTGMQYNADVAVHVNATEAYPQAKAFTQDMVAGQVNGWDWLNQSYHINQRQDLGSGAILDRFKQLKTDSPNLAGVYIDAYYSSGWLSDGLADYLRSIGLQVASEWAYKFEGTSVWSHWANDKNYGGATNKGINSNIIRFIANSQRDVWNTDPLLGGESIVEFEGWTGQNNWNKFYANIFDQDLTTKFIQHFPIVKLDPGKSATLADGVSLAMVNGNRQITMDGVLVADGNTYLLPWQDVEDSSKTSSPAHANKMYFYNQNGGTSTFTLTPQFAEVPAFTLYQLTDQGRVKAADITAVDGKVTLTGAKGQPYVLVPAGGQAPTTADYGKGSGLVDPGFNSGSADPWHPTGGAAIARATSGDNVLQLGTAASGISQQVTGLTAGKRYTFSANVEIAAGARRSVTVSVADGWNSLASKSFDSSPVRNTVAADAKAGTYSQRASVSFIAPAGGTVTVGVSAVAGPAKVTLDDARVMADTSTAQPGGNVVVREDFEGNQPGWGPLVKGDAGGTTDPRTSISIRHDPYSQRDWKNTWSPYNTGSLKGLAVDDVLDGNASLKAHEENTGLVYRTTPATAPLRSGHSYTVSFDYQTNLPGQWQWIVGADTLSGGKVTSATVRAESPAVALTTTKYTSTFVAGCGDAWMGLRKVGSAGGTDFVLDDFQIVDNGPSSTPATCGSLAVGAGDLSPAAAGNYVTSFTNNEATAATNVELAIPDLPAGWTAQVTTANGNLFDTVAPGATVKTTWLLTPPAAAAGTTATVHPKVTYFNGCATKSVSAEALLTVSTRAMIPVGSIKLTTDSAEKSAGSAEGPVTNVLDGDLGTIWHTAYSTGNAPYPHWVQFDLGTTASIDGFGYQNRQSGPNGRIKDYRIEVSTDGTSWTQVAAGSFADVITMQVVNFPAVQARYLKLTGLNALNGQPFASAAEMRVYGTGAAAPAGFDPGHRTADTGCAVDKTALNEAITAASALKKADYTAASWPAFATALAAAKSVTKDRNATQGRVDAALLGLTEARQALVHLADKTALKAAIADAKALRKADYKPSSWPPFAQALANANVVNGDREAPQGQVDSALAALVAAQQALVPLADKTALAAAIASASLYRKADYTPGSWTGFAAALTAAKSVNSDKEASQDQVDAAVSALQDAEAALVAVADKTELVAAIDAAKQLHKADYTLASWAPFAAALAAANAVKADKSATQQQVDAAVTGLAQAQQALVPVAGKDALDAAIGVASGLRKVDYTADSWAAFAAALSGAKSVKGTRDASQAEVDAAVAALTSAQQALVRVVVIGDVTSSNGPLTDGAVVFGPQTFTVSVDAAQAKGISYTYIELNRDGVWLTDNTKAPGSTNAGNSPTLVVDTTTLPNGSYQLKIDAVGRNGAATEKIVKFVVRNLTVAIVAPAAGAAVSGQAPVTVELDGIDLQAYNLRIDSAGLQYLYQPQPGRASFTLDTTTLANGVHTLLATATDKAGHKVTVTRKITVAN